MFTEQELNNMISSSYLLDPPAGQVVRSLIDDVKQLKTWVDDLQSNKYINCVYCGHRYGPDNGEVSQQDILKQHVSKCPDHPMSKLKNELNLLEPRDYVSFKSIR